MDIVAFDDVRFTYDGEANALDGLSFSMSPGEFTCVLGGNGSGKSTMAKHVNGLLVPTSGTVRVLGRKTSDAAGIATIRSNVGMVFQNPDDQIVASIVENDVAFGPGNLGVPKDEVRERVSSALHHVGLQGYEKRDVATLSGGEKQRVAIAGMLAMQPSMLVLDEASAMLDPRGRSDLLRICRQLNDDGMAILLVTHFMEEAAQAHRVLVLENGRIALDGAPDTVLTQVDRLEALSLEPPFAARASRALRRRGVPVRETVHLAVLERELRDVLHAGDSPSERPDARAGGSTPSERQRDDAASARDAPVREGAMPGASGARSARGFRQPDPTEGARADARKTGGPQADKGDPAAPVIEFERVSFAYEMPSRPQRKRAWLPFRTASTQNERVPEESWAVRDVSFALEQGAFLGVAGHTGSGKSALIQLMNGLLQPVEGSVLACGRNLADKRAAAEARRDIGVVFQYPERQLFAATVFDDVAFGPRNLGVPADQLDARVRWALELVHLPADELMARSPFSLSGGQQRRVALAGVLAMQPSTLVLDEPAAGLDPQARRSILKLIREFNDESGLAVVMVSHDMDDLAQLCSRIVVLNQGRIVADGSPADIFTDEDALAEIGLGVPSAAHLANRLGIAYDGIPTVDSLADRIATCRPAKAAR